MSERGSYRSIPCALLAGGDFRRLSERSRWIFVVLKMNMSAAGIDIWYPDELHARLAAESGASIDQVRLTLDILEHEDWIRREDNVLWVVNHITHDPHQRETNPKNRKGIQRHIAGLPHIPLVRAFVGAYPEWFPPIEARSMGLAWALERPSKAPRSTKQNNNKLDNKTDNKDSLSASSTADPDPLVDAPDPLAPPPHEPPAVQTWVQEGAAIWREQVGKMTEPRFGAALKDAVRSHGWPEVKTALATYLSTELARGKQRKVEWFADDVVRWIESSRTRLVGVGGNMTPDELASIGVRL